MSNWFTRLFTGAAASAPPLTPVEATTLRVWLEEGDVLLVDIREPGEHARSHLPRSRSVPLSRYPEHLEPPPGARRVVFYCQSGRRTRLAAARLAGSTDLPAFVLKGGIAGWRD